MTKTPRSPVALEAASLIVDRAARQQFQQFVTELRAEREAAVNNMLSADSTREVLVCKGVALAYDSLLSRIEKTEETLAKHEAGKQKKERAP